MLWTSYYAGFTLGRQNRKQTQQQLHIFSNLTTIIMKQQNCKLSACIKKIKWKHLRDKMFMSRVFLVEVLYTDKTWKLFIYILKYQFCSHQNLFTSPNRQKLPKTRTKQKPDLMFTTVGRTRKCLQKHEHSIATRQSINNVEK